MSVQCVTPLHFSPISERSKDIDGTDPGKLLNTTLSLQMKHRFQQGFTLIELMITVAIIGLLAAIALPSYKDYTIRSKWAANLADIEGLKKAIKVCLVENGGTASACGTLAQIQNHGYSGSVLPTPKYATGQVTMGLWEDGVYINMWGSAEAGNYFFSSKTYTATDGNIKTERTGGDNIPDKVMKGPPASE